MKSENEKGKSVCLRLFANLTRLKANECLLIKLRPPLMVSLISETSLTWIAKIAHELVRPLRIPRCWKVARPRIVAATSSSSWLTRWLLELASEVAMVILIVPIMEVMHVAVGLPNLIPASTTRVVATSIARRWASSSAHGSKHVVCLLVWSITATSLGLTLHRPTHVVIILGRANLAIP